MYPFPKTNYSTFFLNMPAGRKKVVFRVFNNKPVCYLLCHLIDLGHELVL